MSPTGNDFQVTEFAVRLQDILLRRDLIAEGWNDRNIARAVRSGMLHKIRYGAYVAAGHVADLDTVGHARIRSRAVLRTVHETSVLSHQSALLEHEIPVWGLDLSEVHLTRTDGNAGRREAGQVHHRGRLSEDAVVVRHGVRVVPAARAAVEVILSSTPEVGLIALCGVLHAGLATIDDVAREARTAERWSNSLHARLVLDRADSRISSVGEARSWHLFFDQHIPRPQPQVKVFDAAGRLLGIVDFLWPGPGVFLEFDGRLKYDQHRLPGETLEEFIMREKLREEAICAATGWVCIRLTWADLDRPVATARRIQKLLDSRTSPAA